jgi:Tol biopolymer transport system component
MTALKERPQLDPEVLIEEARCRQRKRHRAYAVVLIAMAAVVLYLLISKAASDPGPNVASASPAAGSRLTPPPNAIAFAKATTDGLNARIEIAYVAASGGPVVDLTDAWKHKMITSNPTWSPDGSQIAFVMSPRGHLTRYAGDGDIYVMNANGTDIRKLTHGLAASAPAWSPDGSEIAFIYGQGQALAAIDPDGSHQHIVAHGRGYYESPTWSPDGHAIAYESGPNWSNHAIYTIRPNGTGERRLTPFLGPTEGGAAWSPNGSRIAYSFKDAIWTINTNGANAHPITTCHLPCVSDAGPAWSPTGGKLVFVRDQEQRLSNHHYYNSYRLDVIQPSTGAVRPITPKIIPVATAPDWRP